MLLCIDAGHGGTDSGAVGNGLREKDITLNVSKQVEAYITNNYVVDVLMTRTGDATLTLTGRAAQANNAKADYFVSIHVNAGGGTGYEDYVHANLSDSGTTNQKRVKIHEAVKPVLAKHGLRNRGMKKADFSVLRNTNMAASLIELGFIDTGDANLLKNATYLSDMAAAIANGIADAMGLSRKAPVTPPAGEEVGKLVVVTTPELFTYNSADWNDKGKVVTKGEAFTILEVLYVNGSKMYRCKYFYITANTAYVTVR